MECQLTWQGWHDLFILKGSEGSEHACMAKTAARKLPLHLVEEYSATMVADRG